MKTAKKSNRADPASVRTKEPAKGGKKKNTMRRTGAPMNSRKKKKKDPGTRISNQKKDKRHKKKVSKRPETKRKGTKVDLAQPWEKRAVVVLHDLLTNGGE